MSKSNKNILLTGGHARSTAYALISEIRKRKNKWSLYFVGSKRALEGTKIPTIEMETFPELGVKFVPIFTGRVQRKFTIWTIPSLIKIPFGLMHAICILTKIKPHIVVSFGGYSAFPIVVVGWLFQIPILIHEQTAAVGRVNKITSMFATKIAISRESSRKYFPTEKVVLTGNPVSQGALSVKPKNLPGKPPTIFITGGGTGSVIINSIVEEILESLLHDFKVVHQVGIFQHEKFVGVRNGLPAGLRKRYEVHSTISQRKWPDYLRKADIIISRSGANIVSEILASKRPSILIPLPLAYLDEQKKNADYAKKFGIARVIEQEDLTSKVLSENIKALNRKWGSIVKKARKKESPDTFAAREICELVEDISK
jgi:UDP-N-acetylglucosamine--N-acetylmuramyl-(pentapeptide) pyrophosphoryl-undecaprenol N-acetylglucosamine transferase